MVVSLGEALASKLGLMTDIITDNFLPDTCKILPQEGEDVTIVKGILQQSPPSYREYNDSTDIPCRVDPSRAYRQANYDMDIAVVFEYLLELPLGVEVETSDKVFINDREFNIVKLTDVESYAATKQALILGTDRFDGSSDG